MATNTSPPAAGPSSQVQQYIEQLKKANDAAAATGVQTSILTVKAKEQADALRRVS